MKRIFAPISRLKFCLYIFALYVLSTLYTNFSMFFDLYGQSTFFVLCTEVLIIFLIIFKRFSDIFEKLQQTIIISSLTMLLLIVTYLISISTLTYDAGEISFKNHFLFFLYPVYTLALTLFLALKKGYDCESQKLEVKTVLKYGIPVILSFVILKGLSLTYNAILPQADFRMYPSIELQDRMLISKIFKNTKLERYDIVCIKDKDTLASPLRIIGLPGETVKIEGNEIAVNGETLKDDYAFYGVNLEKIERNETIKLDENSYLLAGDNRYYDRSGKITLLDNKGNKIQKPLSESVEIKAGIPGDGNVFVTTTRDKLFGKVIAIHYDNFKTDKNIKRTGKSYAFAFKDKKFGFNPSTRFKKIFEEE